METITVADCLKKFDSNTLKMKYFNNIILEDNIEKFPFPEDIITSKNEKGEEVKFNAFSSKGMRILSHKGKPLTIRMDKRYLGYLQTLKFSKFANLPYFMVGYINDEEERELPYSMYKFFQTLIDFLQTKCENYDIPLTEKIVIEQMVYKPIKGYRYFIAYPSNDLDIEKCKEIIRSTDDFYFEFSVLLIKHKIHYVPMIYLTAINY